MFIVSIRAFIQYSHFKPFPDYFLAISDNVLTILDHFLTITDYLGPRPVVKDGHVDKRTAL